LRACLTLNQDPSARLAVAATARWAAEVWRSGAHSRRAVGLPRLLDWWGSTIGGEGRGQPAVWREARGPLGAAWLELKRIGWGWRSACVLVKECGTELNLLECSAAAVAKELRDAVMRDHARRLALREWPQAVEGTRVAFEPIVRALATRRWDAVGKGIVRGVACGAIWTRSRLELSGYIVADTTCQKCGVGFDDIHHRLYLCQHREAVEARARALGGEEAAFLARARAEGPSSALYSKAWFPFTPAAWRRPAQTGVGVVSQLVASDGGRQPVTLDAWSLGVAHACRQEGGVDA
jgi:hypothetical protein